MGLAPCVLGMKKFNNPLSRFAFLKQTLTSFFSLFTAQ